MPKDVLWDSQAAQQIENQELDKHYAQNSQHYKKLARDAWDMINRINERPEYLKHGDLYDVLYHVIARDSLTIEAMAKRHLPAPLARGSAQWYAWFTHYIVERFMESKDKAAKNDNSGTEN